MWAALRDALASLTDYRRAVRLDTPATPERVMLAAREQRDWQEQHATAGAEPTQVPS